MILGGLSGALAAQDDALVQEEAPGVTVTDSGNRVIYGPEYFSQYNVITASDQLDRVPGIQGLLGGGGNWGGGGRGFGSSGDQVLINGRRVSGKSNDVGSVLDRIQARQVVRVEVIRGTVPDLDVRSQGRVVNVVLNDTLTTGYGSWQANGESYSDGRYGGGGELSYNGDFGAMSYLFSLEADSRKNSGTSTDLFFTSGNDLFERQSESSKSESQDYSFSTNTSYTFSNGDILNLNGQYSYEDESENDISERYDVAGQSETFMRNFLIGEEGESKDWELGGDYEHNFPNGNRLITRFVYTSESSDERGSFAFMPAGGETEVEDVQVENSEYTEKILRSTYQWGMGEAHSFESGAELAINTVDEQSQLFENNNGMLEETPLFNQESEIEETRYEGFTSYTWQASRNLLVESSLDIEYSEITQQGNDVNRSRDFFFTRPRLVVRYDLNELTQIRSRVERRVGQLNFGSFVASFTNDDNRYDVISAGNPELEPQKSWDWELTYERRLPNDMGVVSVSGQYSDVQDKTGRIPLLVVNQQGVEEERTAPGNIGDGRSVELEFSGSLRLDWLNFEGAVIDASVEFEESNITDPFTGQERDFNWSSPYRWRLGFRHDTSWKNFSYGFNTGKQGPAEQFDLDYTQEMEDDPDLEIFAEMQPIQDLTVRLSAEQILRSERQRERLQYIGNRAETDLLRRELRVSRPSREITLSVQGVF